VDEIVLFCSTSLPVIFSRRLMHTRYAPRISIGNHDAAREIAKRVNGA
jgi:hypothetical protein